MGMENKTIICCFYQLLNNQTYDNANNTFFLNYSIFFATLLQLDTLPQTMGAPLVPPHFKNHSRDHSSPPELMKVALSHATLPPRKLTKRET